MLLDVMNPWNYEFLAKRHNNVTPSPYYAFLYPDPPYPWLNYLMDAPIHFYMLLYAFICFSYAKKQNVVPSSSSSSATYTILRLSRCAAGKNTTSLHVADK